MDKSSIMMVLFIIVFLWNYRRINQMYPNPKVSKVGIGETAELDGYEFTFMDFQLFNGDEIKKIDESLADILEVPDDTYKVLLAKVHIKRIAQEEGNIDMTAVAGECGAWKI